MDVGREIASAFAEIQAEDELEIQRRRYRQAKDIIAEIPSGTRDADLTVKQRRALDQYEDALQRMALYNSRAIA